MEQAARPIRKAECKIHGDLKSRLYKVYDDEVENNVIVSSIVIHNFILLLIIKIIINNRTSFYYQSYCINEPNRRW